MKNKKMINMFFMFMIVTLIIFYVFNRYTRIDYPYTQEYIIGQSNIKGSVDVEYFSKNDLKFEIGANEYGYAVFKEPNIAFKVLKEKYSDGISLIKREYHLPPLSHYTYKIYGIYGSQCITGTKNEKIQADFISKFFDIYENSFK